MDERRWKVEFKYGSYISLAFEQKQEAYRLYREEGGIRLLLCKSIFDDGEVMEGPPVIKDLTETPWALN